jgi:hypothetical protein
MGRGAKRKSTGNYVSLVLLGNKLITSAKNAKLSDAEIATENVH